VLTDVVGVEAMTNGPEHEKRGPDRADGRPRRMRKSVWDDAKIVVNIEYTKPGTALDDYLRREQTRAVLDLLADYVQKVDMEDGSGP
jgi:hypothetical protein